MYTVHSDFIQRAMIAPRRVYRGPTRHEASSWTGREMMAASETLSLQQQAERLHGQYREMTWGTVHPAWREQHQMLTEAGFVAIERHFVRHIPQGTHYLAVAHKR